MKYLFVLALLITVSTGFSAEPEKKPKTDAMLFGDIKCGNEHIPFATIIIKGTTQGTATDATGHFKISNLPVGKQTLIISAVGYKTLEKEVDMAEQASTTILIELETDNIGLEQIVVSADRNNKSRRETATIVNTINAKLFERTQNITLSEGLNFSPGLRMENNCQNCGFTQVRMNGLEGPYSQILINSRPIFSGLAGVYGLELIPANMIERIEVVRGGGSALYGSNAIAGTINLITKDPVANSFGISSNYGANGFGLGGNNSPSNDYNLNFNGSFMSDDFKTGMSLFGFHRKRDPLDVNGDGFSEVSLIQNTTIGARVFQRLSSRGKLTLDYFNINEFRRGGNHFELPLHEADITESVDHGINSGAVSFDQLLRENDRLSAFFSAQDIERKSYYGAGQDLSAYGKTNDFTFSAGVQYNRLLEKLLFSPANLTSGLEINGSSLTDKKLGYYDIENNVHVGNTLVANQSILIKAGFLQSEWVTEKLKFTAGFRFDNYSITDKTHESGKISGNVLSPRLSVLAEIRHNIQFRAGYARGFRAPQIFDEDLHIETSKARQVLHRNAENLKQEISDSFSASLDFTSHPGKWQYQVLTEVFYTALQNPFANEYGQPDENGVVVYTRVNAEKGATVKGFNIELNTSPAANLSLQSGFTVQKSEFQEEREFGEKRFFRSPNNYGYISLNYTPVSLLNVAMTGNYTGPMLVPYFGPRLENPEIGQLNTSDPFFDAGVKVSYGLKLSDEIKMELTGGVKNIFNSFQDDFDTGPNRDPAYIYGPGSPRVVYFGLKFGTLM